MAGMDWYGAVACSSPLEFIRNKFQLFLCLAFLNTGIKGLEEEEEEEEEERRRRRSPWV
jgi:hypothetical protein